MRTAPTLNPWHEVAQLHPDVLSENFSEDIFALDLGPLADGNPQVPAVYRDPEQFFRASYLTNGLKSLLQDVLSRLSGGAGNRVLKLMTPFGGGKSHTLAGLLHAARNPKVLDVVPEAAGLPRPKGVRWAVFDGQFFDATNGKEVPGQGFRTRTLWGWIAWSLRGQEGFDILREQDESRVAPGADEVLALLGDGPNIILLDEVLNYLISAGGVKVLQTTLRDETLTFLQRLTVAVSNKPNSVLVFSLQSSKRESLEYVSLLQTIDHLAARKDQRREPVEKDEVLLVIQRRLLAKLPTAEEASPAATAFQEIHTQMRRAYAKTAAEAQQADQEGIELRDRIRAAYPLHPALIDVMRERWAAIPDFQRTRGALRFIAACLRAAKREEKSRAVLGPGDVPIHDPEVRLAFFKEVGQQADYQAVLEHDFLGAQARVRRIDERRAKEVPAEAGRRPATRLATAILMYSFGGLRREGGGESELLPPGISEPELLSVCVGPDLDYTTVQACLKELREQCLYLHFDGVRYCFKKDPNVTLLVEQESNTVARDEKVVEDKIKEMLEERLAGHCDAIIWPTKSGEIPHKEPSFLIAYLPLGFATLPPKKREEGARDLFENYGDKPRSHRNGLGLAVPSSDQVEALRRSVRYLIAIERVKAKAKQHNLTDEQKSQLRERESSERSAAESAFLRLYTEVLLPRVEEGGMALESLTVGGRPLQVTLNANKQAAVHERVMEILTNLHRRLFGTLTPAKLIEHLRLGEGTPPVLGIRTADVVSAFYSFPGFTRLTSGDVIRKTIARGVQDGAFAYTSGAAPSVGEDGRYKVAPEKVRFERPVAEDEVDLETGFIMMPQARPIPVSAPVVPGGAPPEPGAPPPSSGPVTVPPSGGPPPSGPVPPERMKQLEINFSANRDQLFTAWNAVANLADMAGKVDVTVRASSADGFEASRLENGVLEPLREADLIPD